MIIHLTEVLAAIILLVAFFFILKWLPIYLIRMRRKEELQKLEEETAKEIRKEI